MERQAIEELRSAQGELSRLVRGQLEALFGSLDLSDPAAARNLLLELVPELVHQYGAVAETIARDWYEEHRADAGLTGAYRVEAPPPSITSERVQSKVRYEAGKLWTPTPGDMLAGLAVAVDKYVKQPGRDLIQHNAEREGARWARVPTGAKTCAWCLILASRDAVYSSKRAALRRGDDGHKYHGDCDCQAVLLGRDEEYPDGYLPAEYEAMYSAARDNAASGSIQDIAEQMRRLFPNHLTDGVHAHAA